MKALRRGLDEFIGLFVADWRQALCIVLAVAVVLPLMRTMPAVPSGFLLAALLVVQLVVWCVLEARRRTAHR